jgi:hypothetical protein
MSIEDDEIYPVSPKTQMERLLSTFGDSDEWSYAVMAEAVWACAFAELRKLAKSEIGHGEADIEFLDAAEREVGK